MKKYSIQFKAFGTSNELLVYSESKAEAERAFKLARREARRLEQKFFGEDPTSTISHINRNAFHTPVDCDDETARILDYASCCHALSSGVLDPTVRPLCQLWAASAPDRPSADQLKTALETVGWHHVQWIRPTIQFQKKGIQIDLRPLAKDYAVDSITRVLEEEGFLHALVRCGGRLRAIGPQATGAPWKVGIQHPFGGPESLLWLALRRGSLTALGDYENLFDRAAKTAPQLINAKTGMPANGFLSVITGGTTCILAGTYAALAMASNQTEGASVLLHSGLSYLAIAHAGDVVENKIKDISETGLEDWDIVKKSELEKAISSPESKAAGFW